MKNLIIIIGIASALMSCKKEEKCNCGYVKDDAIEMDASNTMYYTLTVESECSGIVKKFYVSESDWYSNHVGDYTCVNNVPAWSPKAPITQIIHKNK